MSKSPVVRWGAHEVSILPVRLVKEEEKHQIINITTPAPDLQPRLFLSHLLVTLFFVFLHFSALPQLFSRFFNILVKATRFQFGFAPHLSPTIDMGLLDISISLKYLYQTLPSFHPCLSSYDLAGVGQKHFKAFSLCQKTSLETNPMLLWSSVVLFYCIQRHSLFKPQSSDTYPWSFHHLHYFFLHAKKEQTQMIPNVSFEILFLFRINSSGMNIFFCDNLLTHIYSKHIILLLFGWVIFCRDSVL